VKILIIGSGGREHALAWRLASEGHRIYGAPGNPGIAQTGEIIASQEYLAVAEAVNPDLTVVGPEAPLAAGVVDQFRAAGRAIVGPRQEAARLEASKIHSKEFMQRLGIPTARSVRVDDVDAARKALAQFDYPVVIKADGLAAGKGVVIAQDAAQAQSAIQALGPRLVIEEFLRGEEISFIALCDGRNAVALEATQDHKTVGDGDTGPNTGGMGAYCDGRILTASESERLLDLAILPVVEAASFSGFLYAGLMMTAEGPKVLEYNVRLGDPETQPLMHRIDAPFGEALMASAQGGLAGVKLRWKPQPSVCVVLAAAGYPGQVRTGDPIRVIETGSRVLEAGGTEVFQASTRIGERGLETAGGRVLGVTARGSDLAAAVANAYAVVEKIHFDGMHYRHDIAKKGLKRWAPIQASGA
jgi:phosphoribosylamine--glycine ligase